MKGNWFLYKNSTRGHLAIPILWTNHAFTNNVAYTYIRTQQEESLNNFFELTMQFQNVESKA
jgi:hypothetical protein